MSTYDEAVVRRKLIESCHSSMEAHEYFVERLDDETLLSLLMRIRAQMKRFSDLSVAPLRIGLFATVVLGGWVQSVRAEAALPIVIENGNILVGASINNVPLRLIVDSGGKGELQLKPEIARKIHVHSSAKLVIRRDGAGVEYSGHGFTVRTLYLGNSKFKNISGFVRGEAKGGHFGSLPADGILGMEFLRKFVARFDYPSKTLTLFRANERARSDPACSGASVPLVPHPGKFWVSEAKGDFGAFRIAWDTGATYSFISSTVARANKLRIDDGLYSTKTFSVGNAMFGPTDFVVLDIHVPEVDALIGSNFFSSHVICFDGPDASITVATP